MHGPNDTHLLEKILEDNDQLALHNKEHFSENNTYVVNFMSAPGAGKTTLLSSTIEALKAKYSLSVIEGDMVGELDKIRLEQTGVAVKQISTGRSCHLDAKMIAQTLHSGNLPKTNILFIENVGNLVCPAEFPLGENLRVVLLSVTEGDDKPFKYPVIFHNCDAVLFTKVDLLAHVDFDEQKAKSYIANLNPKVPVFMVSTKNPDSLNEWYQWLESKYQEAMLAVQK